MDLNQKYSDHQRAVLLASAAPSAKLRETHLAAAENIAGQIERYQLKLGAAASCAWSVSKRGASVRGAVGSMASKP